LKVEEQAREVVCWYDARQCSPTARRERKADQRIAIQQLALEQPLAKAANCRDPSPYRRRRQACVAKSLDEGYEVLAVDTTNLCICSEMVLERLYIAFVCANGMRREILRCAKPPNVLPLRVADTHRILLSSREATAAARSGRESGRPLMT
jgi:hypothetical protein